MSNNLGIENIKKTVTALKILAKAGKKIGADGKIDLNDLPHLVELAKESGALAAGIDGAGMVIPEAKDLSAEELVELVQFLIDTVQEVRAA